MASQLYCFNRQKRGEVANETKVAHPNHQPMYAYFSVRTIEGAHLVSAKWAERWKSLAARGGGLWVEMCQVNEVALDFSLDWVKSRRDRRILLSCALRSQRLQSAWGRKRWFVLVLVC
jgi:hypothetical protein